MDAVEEIKQRLSIEDVLSEYVELKRAGRNFKGLSPFSNEKTASLMVSPEKQIWHDFSSGKGGNMFSFVMEMEGLDFKGALELLARKAGLDLSQFQRSGGGNTKLKQRLAEANHLAAKFYQVHLSKNQAAISYIFTKRHIDKPTALAFQLGYAPNNGAALTDFLVKKGFSVEELKQAGLTTQRYSQPGDMFRGRIMIPLMDASGQVIGFTGRLLEDIPNAPKYLNTPQTVLYDKSRHVFGLHLAKEAIRKSKFAVIVEGNLDVVASHQAKVNNVVATAGTAITQQHLKTLERFVHDVRLAFDQDSAGIAATERAIPLASEAGVNLGIVTVVGAKDPDELIQKDPAAWQQAIDQPQYALDWLMAVYKKRLDLTTAQGKREYSDVILNTVRALKDQVEQEHYVEALSKVLGVSKEALMTKLAAPTSPARALRNRHQPLQFDAKAAEVIKIQIHLLALALMVPNLRVSLKDLRPEMFPEEDAQAMLAFLQANPDFKGQPTAVEGLKKVAEYSKMLVLLFEELYQGLETLELRYEATRLQVRLVERYVKAQKAVLTAAIRQPDSDEKTINQLLQQAKALDDLLKPSPQGDTHATS
ncbi:MAG: DNA primase [Candidatus Saccharimonadales bacterium]